MLWRAARRALRPTPTTSFLFQSFGFPVPGHPGSGRGWCFSTWPRRARPRGGWLCSSAGPQQVERGAFVGAALLLTAIEYRASPIDFPAVEPQPAPVYAWLARVRVPGAVLELPIGFDYDAEHVFRSTAHWRPLINGYSGFAPKHYDELKVLFDQRPVPDEAWARTRALDGALLLLHPYEAENLVRLNLARATRKALSEGKLEMLGSFPHDGSRDFVFRSLPPPAFEPARCGPAIAGSDFERLSTTAASELAPPFGVNRHPPENAEVAAEVRSGLGARRLRHRGDLVATELGPGPPGALGGARPDIPPVHPDKRTRPAPGSGSCAEVAGPPT